MKYDIDEALNMMEVAFRILEEAVPSPIDVIKGMGFVPRYKEEEVEQVLNLKLAKLQSNLRAAKILLEHGYFYEQNSLQRGIEETNEDILFLVYGIERVISLR